MLDLLRTITAAGVSAAVAFGTMVVTILFLKKNFVRELQNQEMNLVATRLRYFEDFRTWADQAVESLTEAIHLCDLDPNKVQDESVFSRRHRLRIAISSMIDKGRWFYPNIILDEHGAHKEEAYRGYRHELLDGLVEAYGSLQRLDYENQKNNWSVRKDLTAAKRHFVSQVQIILDPSRRNEEFERMCSEVRASRQDAASGKKGCQVG
jgi:hypothetical protein